MTTTTTDDDRDRLTDYYGVTPDDAGCIELAEWLHERRAYGLEG